MSAEWLSANEAATLLGVKRATLYAYASRGAVRSRPQASSRKRQYSRDDLLRLMANNEARAGHGAVAAGALRWGQPVLDSAITEITTDGPRYRGYDVNELASRDTPVDSVAELLWFGGDLVDRASMPKRQLAELAERLIARFGRFGGGSDVVADPLVASRLCLSMAEPWIEEMKTSLRSDSLPYKGNSRSEACARTSESTRSPNTDEVGRLEARLIMRTVVAGVALTSTDPWTRLKASANASTMEGALLGSLGLRANRGKRRAIRTALIVCADHELNASSFAARIAASAGASLCACVCAALATLSGDKHGGAPEQVLQLIDRIGEPQRVARSIADRLERGERIVGFGHPLYPKGDPRAANIMAAAQQIAPRNRRLQVIEALIDVMALTDAGPPSVDVALAALSAALKLPAMGAVTLFAAGRVAGWLAHAMEQRRADYLLRPRARYVGPGPRPIE